MSALLDLHPTPGHPGVVVAGVHEALDGIGPVELGQGEYAGVVTECERAIRRLEALKLKLVAAADTARVSDRSGHASTAAWLASQTKAGNAKSARDAKLANDLDTKLPRHRGRAGRRRGLARARRRDRGRPPQAPDPGSPTTRSRPSRLGWSRRPRSSNPQQLRRVARRALEAVERDREKVDAHEDQQLRDEEAAALAQDPAHAATTTATARPRATSPSPPSPRSILRKVLDAMTAPDGRSPARPRAGRRPRASRRLGAPAGLAFVEILEHLPTDRLHTKTAATVVVTLDHDTLVGQLKAAGLDTDDLVSSSEARRLACTAGILPAVLGGQSQPLDLGRTKRLFTEAQRVALGLTHTTCAADGCERPYAWCELHHRNPLAT